MPVSRGKRNKQRGYELENESVKLARSFGLEAERCWLSDGRAKGLHKNVDIVIGGQGYQCKRRKKLAAYMTPDEGVVGQIIREDYGPPLVTVPLEHYLQMLIRLEDRHE